jgi:hypothetical protein
VADTELLGRSHDRPCPCNCESLELLLAAPRSVFIYFASSGAEDDETKGAVWREGA